jgi:hypothetical protein
MTEELIIAFGIMGLCLVIHVMGIVYLGDKMIRRRERIAESVGLTYPAFLLIFVFSVLIVLHVLEATIWAGFYAWRGLFHDFETSLYFSLTSYSTLGYGDVLLPARWRLLGTIEGISGVLLCGVSVAFLFVIVNAIFQFRRKST